MEFINNIVVERVAYITLNRPQKRNAFNEVFIDELINIFNGLILNVDVKVIVIKAAGSVFSAGADLDYLQKLQSNSFDENLADTNSLKNLFKIIYDCPKITIAQVEGDAIAGGCGLASVCDFIFSVPTARFGYTEVKIGFIPALVSCFLTRKIGDTRTRELLLSGNLIDASTALRYNLINFIVESNQIDQHVKSYAEKLAVSVSSTSINATKKLLNFIWDHDLETSLERAVIVNAEVRETDDCKKGISAFLNKENLNW